MSAVSPASRIASIRARASSSRVAGLVKSIGWLLGEGARSMYRGGRHRCKGGRKRIECGGRERTARSAAGGSSMASPFPGMNPYLEGPAHWPDFHATFITYAREALLQALPKHYTARIAERVYL